MMKDMPEFSDQPDAPSLRYELRVNGRLTGEAADWFDDMTLSIDKTTTPSQTVIQGTIRDQSALYGLISRIRDLGLLLLSVNLIDREMKEKDGEIEKHT